MLKQLLAKMFKTKLNRAKAIKLYCKYVEKNFSKEIDWINNKIKESCINSTDSFIECKFFSGDEAKVKALIYYLNINGFTVQLLQGYCHIRISFN